MTVDARFCPRCGTALPEKPPTTCTACGYAMYVNARPTGTAIIVAGNQFLAVLRTKDPQAGWWDLPGGFCDGWEPPADAAVREAREELGLTVRLGLFVGMYIGGYHFQGEVLPVLDCFWLASIVEGDIVPDPAEVADYRWLPLDDPPQLAFTTMNQAIVDARKCLESPGAGK